MKLWSSKKKSTQNLKINLKTASTQPASHTICALCINNQETSQVKVPAIYTFQHREETATIHRSQQFSAHPFLTCTVKICSRTSKELEFRRLAPSASALSPKAVGQLLKTHSSACLPFSLMDVLGVQRKNLIYDSHPCLDSS